MEAKFLDGRRGSFIMDHQVMGKILVPGAAFMELAGAVGNICLRDGDAVVLVQNATIPAPLEVTSNRASVESSLQVTVSRENGSISLSSGALTHLKGFLRPCVDLNLGAGAASDASIATGVSEAGVPRRGRALVIRGTSTHVPLETSTSIESSRRRTSTLRQPTSTVASSWVLSRRWGGRV